MRACHALLAALSDNAHRFVGYLEEDDALADEWVFVSAHPVLLGQHDRTRCR
ncbi:hypothetical protein [Nocardia sp. NPDC004604]|uniref:hypothetical protein n=1 Tax=Nocardia sp. NPDC004604 TaxID=3157013 RepID=UPI0033BD4C7A